MNKFLMSFMSLVLSVGVLAGITSCGNKNDNVSSNENTTSDSTLNDGKIDYSISIKSKVGIGIEGLAFEIYDENNKLVGLETTDADGNYNTRLPAGNYRVEIYQLPDGYVSIQDSYTITAENPTLDIVCGTELIMGEEIPEEKFFELGDIMYDFTCLDVDNNTIQLSKMLEEYDMVLINFWYNGCPNCDTEFPFMDAAYREVNEDGKKVGIVAFVPQFFEGQNNGYDNTVNGLKQYRDSMVLSFPVAQDKMNLYTHFVSEGYPTSVVIDRYGMVCAIEIGAIISSEDFIELFDHFIGDSYKPVLSDESGEFVTLPDITQPDSALLEAACSGEGFNGKFHPEESEGDAEYSWPWIVSEDGQSIEASNSRHSSSYATVYTSVTLNENQVFAFDYFAETQQGGDNLYVLVDRTIVQMISGVSEDWETCYCYVPVEAGEHEVVFIYMKNRSGNYGNDTVKIKNLRVQSVDTIDQETYVFRYAASGLDTEKNEYTKYITPVFNKTDGYYHVGSENGPILFAELLNATNWSGDSIFGYTGYGETSDVPSKYPGLKKYTNVITEYASYQSRSENDLVPVTETLKQALIDVVNIIKTADGDTAKENEWLEICCYYSTYGTNGVEMGDTIKGLATFSAYEGVLGEDNGVYFTEPLMPRGKMVHFRPEQTAVYKIYPSSKNQFGTEVWLLDANERTLAAQETWSVLYYTLEAGKDYYINVAFETPDIIGELLFNIELYGVSYDQLEICSPVAYTTAVTSSGEMDLNNIIAGGIDVAIGEDGYYHQKLANGQLGSIIYMDFTHGLDIIGTSIQKMIEAGSFNFTDKPFNGYTGEDYTDIMRGYLDKAETVLGESGLVPVTEELANILDISLGRSHFVNYYPLLNAQGQIQYDAEGEIIYQKDDNGNLLYSNVEGAWKKCCYYIHHYGA